MFKKILLTFVVVLLSACSSVTTSSKDQLKHFATKEKALQSYIKDEKVTGTIQFVTTTSVDHLLVTEESNHTFFVGELNKNQDGYYAVKLSNSTRIDPDALGMAWGFKTMNGHSYTIYFQKSNGENFISFPNSDYYFSILKGDTLIKNKNTIINAIDKVE